MPGLNRLTQMCGYADDILVFARSLPALEALCEELRKATGRVRLVIRLSIGDFQRPHPEDL